MATCPSCGEQNPDRFRFCGACGSALDRADGSVVEERKIVSILFVDLVDFTRRSHASDPEDVRASLARYYRRLKQEIEHFGGRVEKFIGDAVVAVFGAPAAHEDDGERAVRAALRIISAIDEMNEALPGLDLAVRAAVDTGEVVVALRGAADVHEGIVGDVVNTTARLQALAPPGGVVVGESTYRSTKDFILYEPLGPMTVKGKPDPLPVFRAVAARSRHGVDVDHGVETPFIGRVFELAALGNAFERMLHDRSLQLVSIIGEPGVGKTRLVSEFFALSDQRRDVVLWRQGRSLSYGEGISFWALSEIVKAQAGILESDSPEAARAKLDTAVSAVVEVGVDRDWLVTRLSPLVGVKAPGTDRQELFTAWTRFLEAVALRRPLILVFEDLHWAGAGMLDFLEHLMEWASSAPVLLLCTARPELYEHRPGWGGGKRDSQTITLTPLTDEESARLVEELVTDATLGPRLRTLLLERAEGNPLYAEELVRMLRDRGLLDGAATELLVPEEVDIPLPESIQALISARLDTLAIEYKELLHDASVVGKVFWVGALSSMEDVDEDSVVESLRALADKEFVRRLRTSSIADQIEHSFRHALIKDVAYSQIPRRVRGRKHRAAAAWIERIAGDRVIDHAELLAYHHLQGLELAIASGSPENLSELRSTARRALVLAGDRAMQLDVVKAEGYYREALRLSEGDSREGAMIAANLVDASWLAGRITAADAERDYTEAVQQLLDSGEQACAGEVMVKLSRVQWERGDRPAGRTTLARAVELLEQGEPGPELAFAYAQMAGEKWASGATDECLEWSEKTIALATRFGMEEQAIRARGFRGCARCDVGDLDGLQDVRRALALALEAGLGRETCIQYNNLGYLEWLWKGPSTGVETYREGIAFAEGRGLRLEALWMRTSAQETLYDLGRWDEVLATAEETVRLSQEHGYHDAMLAATADKVLVLTRRGDMEEAARLRPELVRHARASGEAQLLVPALVLEALAGDVRADGSRELCDVVLTDSSREWLRHLADVGRVLASSGLTDCLERLLERIDSPYPRHRYSLLTGRAALAESVGDVATAASLYEQACGAWASFGCIFEQGQALLGAGRTLLTDRRSEATAKLEDALGIFRRLGAAPAVDETVALLPGAVRRL